MMANEVYVVDDDKDMLELLHEISANAGLVSHVYLEATSLQAALLKRSVSSPIFLVMDIVMPEFDGIELLMWLSELDIPVKVIIVSGYDQSYLDTAEALALAYGIKVVGIFNKPFRVLDLTELLKNENEFGRVA